MKKFLFTALLPVLIASAQAFGQTNATLSGTVTDATGAVMPGIAITTSNTGTGVVSTTISNNAGVYNFASLLPGTYRVSAEQPGFQPQTFTDVQLGSGAQVRLNFRLQVGRLEQSVEVSVAAERVLLESSSSAGDALAEKTVQDLPLVKRNVLDLVKVMSGVVLTDSAVFGANDTTFAGVSAAGVNIQRDGIAVNDVRWPTGVNAATRVNPDLVGEFRMILAPVDAEAGRGNAQIQIQTRSGTNKYHGALAWNVQNTALDANTWTNNRSGIVAPWRNREQYTLSIGGPIVKNKTHFFALWDGQVAKTRAPYNTLALTPCAQRGIFRYYDGWNNGNQFQVTTATGATPTIAVVNADGTPRPPATTPAGVPHNGILRYASVFGRLANTPTKADCSDAIVQGAPWDPYRVGMDATGYMAKFINMMPKVNNYDIGDGLNSAGSYWSRTLYGADNVYGIGEDSYRRQINVRIDHNFNERHRAHGSYSYEQSWADNNFRVWPNGYGGRMERYPQVVTFNFISALRPTLLNEARFGMSRTGSNSYGAFDNPYTAKDLQAQLPNVNGVPVALDPGDNAFGMGPDRGGAGRPSNVFGSRGNLPNSSNDVSPRWTLGDTISWTKGTHSLRSGGEFRRATSLNLQRWIAGPAGGITGGYTNYPFALGGDAATVAVAGINSTNMTGLVGTPSTGNQAAMEGMLNFLSGSLAQVRQWRFINSGDQTSWNDPLKDNSMIRDLVQNEFAFFFKDDWKVKSNLTLNLGVRYEYFGVPYLKNGLTTGLQGGGAALFGISGRSIDNWMQPGVRGAETALAFIGPDSPNPGLRPYERDYNNFGPAIGFAWQVPWLGRGKTTMRGGYQLSYIGNNGRARDLQGVIGWAPGTSFLNSYTGTPGDPYIDLTDLPKLVPVPVAANILPGIVPVPVTDRVQNMTAFDSNYVAPYIQNLTLAVTRNVTNRLTVDVRYIGTLSRKLYGSLNINQPNFITNGLLEAFNAARFGGESTLLDSMLNGQSLVTGAGYGPVGTTVNGVLQTGAHHLRNSTSTATAIGSSTQIRTALATGNYAVIANTLNFLGFPAGQLLRSSGKFPENFIKTNPQFNTATFMENSGHANYHSLQAQVTLRPTAGVNFQSTYTWSKNLGLSGVYTDPRDRAADYTLMASQRTHNWVTYGNWDLPFGHGKPLAGNSSGIVDRLIGGWQTSWIVNVISGAPANIAAADMLYGNGVPDIVGPFDFDSVGTVWDKGAASGNYFGGRYHTVPDPQCSSIAANLRTYCTLQAVADSSGQIIFQNPRPGMRGNFGRNRIFMPGRWNVDMAFSKSIPVSESKSFRIRVDASNVFNHPRPADPSLSINSSITPFGDMGSKTDVRSFQFTARFDF